MVTGGDAGDCATWFVTRMDHHAKIEDLPPQLFGLEEVDTPRSWFFRGAERPPWPKIAAADGAGA
jgi:hypothetical protein